MPPPSISGADTTTFKSSPPQFGTKPQKSTNTRRQMRRKMPPSRPNASSKRTQFCRNKTTLSNTVTTSKSPQRYKPLTNFQERKSNNALRKRSQNSGRLTLSYSRLFDSFLGLVQYIITLEKF